MAPLFTQRRSISYHSANRGKWRQSRIKPAVTQNICPWPIHRAWAEACWAISKNLMTYTSIPIREIWYCGLQWLRDPWYGNLVGRHPSLLWRENVFSSNIRRCPMVTTSVSMPKTLNLSSRSAGPRTDLRRHKPEDIKAPSASISKKHEKEMEHPVFHMTSMAPHHHGRRLYNALDITGKKAKM